MQSTIQQNQIVNRDPARWRRSRAFLKQAKNAPNLREFAVEYLETYGDCPPGPFHVGKRQLKREINRAFHPAGFMTRLLSLTPDPVFATAHAEDLEIDFELEHLTRYHHADNLATWKHALTDAIRAPLWYRQEVGSESGVVHAHAVTDRAACRGIGFQVDTYDPQRLHGYLKKAIPWSAENLAVFLEAKLLNGDKPLARKSSTVGVPNARTWSPISA